MEQLLPHPLPFETTYTHMKAYAYIHKHNGHFNARKSPLDQA